MMDFYLEPGEEYSPDLLWEMDCLEEERELSEEEFLIAEYNYECLLYREPEKKIIGGAYVFGII